MRNNASIRQNCILIEAALSFIGAGIAGILWWQDRTAADLPCSSQGGCESVWNSAWSHIDIGAWHAVPVALIGLVGYLFLFSLSMLRLASESERMKNALHSAVWLVSTGGAGYSWYLQWIAHYKIGHFCIWCRSSAIIMTLIFFLAVFEFLAARSAADGELVSHA